MKQALDNYSPEQQARALDRMLDDMAAMEPATAREAVPEPEAEELERWDGLA